MSDLQKPGDFQCTLLRACELPPEYREVFMLKEIKGHTLAEIANLLGISVNTALVRFQRARHAVNSSGGVTESVR